MKTFYKVYEILDNTSEELTVYSVYFVGAFADKKMAESLCECIDVANCNSTKIIFGNITKNDVIDLKTHGWQGGDKEVLEEISAILKQLECENKTKKQTNQDNIR